METNTEPKLEAQEFSGQVLQVQVPDGAAMTDETLQKNKDSIRGDTRVAPTGSLFLAATRYATSGAGGTINFPELGHKTGILYIITDDESAPVPGYSIFKIRKAIEGYFFYVYFKSVTNANSIKIDPTILGTKINDSTSVLTITSEFPTIFVGTDNGWYTINS